jgi:hypothetical protein
MLRLLRLLVTHVEPTLGCRLADARYALGTRPVSARMWASHRPPLPYFILHPSHRALWVSFILSNVGECRGLSDNSCRSPTSGGGHPSEKRFNVIKCNHSPARRPTFTLKMARHEPLRRAHCNPDVIRNRLQNALSALKSAHQHAHVTILQWPGGTGLDSTLSAAFQPLHQPLIRP